MIESKSIMKCPACGIGKMLSHDVGYDECDVCLFYAIYDDGRQPAEWSTKELEKIYAQALKELDPLGEGW